MMNQIMTVMHKNGELKPKDAGLMWLKKHPKTCRGWLKDIKSYDGKPALPVFEKYMSTVK